MAGREEEATARFSLRLQEHLRARLEAEAELHGMSLNAEISYRLESSLNQQDVGQSVFGDEDIFTTVYMIGQLIRGFEQANSKKLRQDFKTIITQSVSAVFQFLDFAAESRGGLNKEYPIRHIVDLAVFNMIQKMITTQPLSATFAGSGGFSASASVVETAGVERQSGNKE